MHYFFFRGLRWFLLTGLLLGLCGCASLTDTLPTPPLFMTPINLGGPFDGDIPFREAGAIRKASLIQNRVVPYLFLRVASSFEQKGDPKRSIHFFNRAMEEFRRRDNLPGEGTAFCRKISALIRFGYTETAYLAVEEMDKKWSNSPRQAFVLYGYGLFYLKKTDYARANKYFNETLACIPQEPGNFDWLLLRRDAETGCGLTVMLAEYFPAVSGRMSSLSLDEAFFQDIRKKVAGSLPHLEKVPVLNRDILSTEIYHSVPELISPVADCDAYNLLGLAHGIAGNASESVKNLNAAMALAKKNDYVLGEADNLYFLSHVYLPDGNRIAGIEAAQALAEVAKRHQLVSYSIWAKMMMAFYAKRAGDASRADSSLDAALSLWEETAAWLPCGNDFRGNSFFNRWTIYETQLNLRAAGGDERGAFRTAERMKGAFLAAKLAEARIGKTDAMRECIEKIHTLHEQLADNYKKLMTHVNGPGFTDAAEKIRKARKACKDLLAEIKKEDVALSSLIDVAVPTLEEIQRQLDRNTTLFTYFVGEDSFYIWVLSRNGFHQEKIRMSRVEVEGLVQAWLDAMASRDRGLTNTLAEKVYDTFLKPVIPFVYGDRLGFVPHGMLYNLPYAAMRYVKSYLVDGFSIFQVPHTGMLRFLFDGPPVTEAEKAIFLSDAACPEKTLPAAQNQDEMDVLKKLIPQAERVVLNRSLANDLQKISGNYDIIYIRLNHDLLEQTPTGPCRLADARQHPGPVDFFRLKLQGRLTLLGVCGPAEGSWATDVRATAFLGEWLYAGSQQVLIKRWDVEERAQKVFWKMFYEYLKKGVSTADALRAAQNGMIQAGYGPSDWAAFILTGRY